MKKHNFLLSLFALLLMDLLYFLWQPYPKGIIKTISSPWAYSDIITGILYFLIFAAVIDISVRSIARLKEPSPFFGWKNVKYMAALIAVQLCLDLIKLAGVRLLNEYAAIVYDMLTVVGWGLFTLLFSCMTERTKSSEKRERIAVGIAAAALLLCVLLDIGDIVQRRALIEKYKPASQMLESRFVNIQFRFELRNMLLDFCCGAAFLTFFMMTGKETSQKKKNRYGVGGRLVSQMFVLLNAFIIVYLAKAFILPNKAIFPQDFQHSGYSTDYQLALAEYDIWDADVFTIFRTNGIGKKNPIYCVSKDIVWYNGENLFRFKTEGRYVGGEGGIAKDIIDYNAWQTVQIDDADAAIFASQEIVWVNDSETVHLSFKDLASAEENPVLTALCLERIAAGDWRFFEYGTEYLLKVEPEFILPYIERYAAGDFTDSEVRYSCDYNPEYIQKVAKTARNNIGQ